MSLADDFKQLTSNRGDLRPDAVTWKQNDTVLNHGQAMGLKSS